MRQKSFITFNSFSGTKYEICVLFDPEIIISPPSEITEDEKGCITLTGRMSLYNDAWDPNLTGNRQCPKITWESLSEMTHQLKLEILSWGSDLAN